MEDLFYADDLRKTVNSFHELLKNQNKLFYELLENLNNSFELISNSHIDSYEKLEKSNAYYKNLCEKSFLVSNTGTSKTNEVVIDSKFNNNEVIVDDSDKLIEFDSTDTSIDDISVTKSNYNALINEYLISCHEALFMSIIEEFPDKIDETLKLCINKLPEDINTIAELYNFENKLFDLKKYNNNLIKLKENKRIDITQSYLQLCDNYENAFNKKRPQLIKRFIQQIYVKYPDKFDEFKTRYKMPININRIMLRIKSEFDEIETNNNDVKINIEKSNKHHRTDLKTVSVEKLIQQIDKKTNKKSYIIRYAKGLHKHNRLKEYNEFKNHFPHLINLL